MATTALAISTKLGASPFPPMWVSPSARQYHFVRLFLRFRLFAITSIEQPLGMALRLKL
jgi:hypothetical protein